MHGVGRRGLRSWRIAKYLKHLADNGLTALNWDPAGKTIQASSQIQAV